ncbi:MAG: AAA family ATPase [Acidimicrobiaceae bacterium]|nr:AAA family ATPase [Acidimicrobiaceae bacterium]
MAETAASVVETHISTLFFVGNRVYKLKKGLRTGFLDWTTADRRREACLNEVALNRRIAPDVYLGVAEVRGPDGEWDSLVVMRRMPAEANLARLVTEGADVSDRLRSLAKLIADFHAGCRHDTETAAAGTPEAVAANWADNSTEMAPYGTRGLLDEGVLHAVADLSQAYVRGRRDLFVARIAAGRVRDGHGDLQAADVFLLDDGPRVLDCLEFDPRLRHGDVLADVAFLAMDLERLGAAREAARFLEWYREFSGDHWPASLAHHWIAYRAQVRAKVACLRHDQGDPAASAEAAALLGLSHRHLDRGAPRLVLVGGLPGTGKSTLAAALADRLGYAVLSTDELRHQLEPGGGGDGYRTGLYRPEVTAATYRALLDQAGRALAMGELVILDASWSDARWRRQAAETAAHRDATLVELVCEVPAPIAEERIRLRRAAGAGASDATAAIARRMAADADPWPTAHRVETAGPVDDAVAAAMDLVDAGWRDDWP